MRQLRLVVGQRAPTGVVLSLSALVSIGGWLIAVALDLSVNLIVPIISLGAIFVAITFLYLKTTSWLNDSRSSSIGYANRLAKDLRSTIGDNLTAAVAQIKSEMSATQRG